MLKLYVHPSKKAQIWSTVRLMLAAAYVQYYSLIGDPGMAVILIIMSTTSHTLNDSLGIMSGIAQVEWDDILSKGLLEKKVHLIYCQISSIQSLVYKACA